MEILVNVKHISEPTLQTFYEYAAKRAKSLKRFMPGDIMVNNDVSLKISGEYINRKNCFELKFILSYRGGTLIFQATDEDLRRAIDAAKDNFKVQLNRSKRY